MPTTLQGLRLRRLEPEKDLDELLQLFETVFHRQASVEIWQWKYLPPWTNHPYAWVTVKGGEIVGHVGAVCLRGLVDGGPTSFFQIGDVMVHPDHRGAFPDWAKVYSDVLQEIRTECPSAMCYGFTGIRTARFYEWIGLSALLEEADDRLVRMGPSDRTDAIELRRWEWTSRELDTLWQKLRYSTPVGLVRDREYLRWRYGSHPVYCYSLWGVYEGGHSVGWLATERRATDSDEVADEVRVLDMLLPPDVRVRTLEAACRAVRAKTLVLWHPSRLWPDHLESRRSGWVVMDLHVDSDEKSRNLAQNLYYSLGDADEWWW